MKKCLTLEEAAHLNNTIQAPPRLPYHADVNGNPVYQQFMRLTHIYEEDELVKRQDEMQALAARLAMIQGLSTGRPPVPRFETSGQGPEATPGPTPPGPSPGPSPRPSPMGTPMGTGPAAEVLALQQRAAAHAQENADQRLLATTDEERERLANRERAWQGLRRIADQLGSGARHVVLGKSMRPWTPCSTGQRKNGQLRRS